MLRSLEDLHHIVYSEVILFFFFSNPGAQKPLSDLFVVFEIVYDDPIIFFFATCPKSPWTNLRAFRGLDPVGWGRRRGAGRPPGGAVGEGKWAVIQRATAETPSVCWLYEAVIHYNNGGGNTFFLRHSMLVFVLEMCFTHGVLSWNCHKTLASLLLRPILTEDKPTIIRFSNDLRNAKYKSGRNAN